MKDFIPKTDLDKKLLEGIIMRKPSEAKPVVEHDDTDQVQATYRASNIYIPNQSLDPNSSAIQQQLVDVVPQQERKVKYRGIQGD